MLHAAGFRITAATNDSPIAATVKNNLDLYRGGVDVVYTYNLTNSVTARVEVNTARNLTPP